MGKVWNGIAKVIIKYLFNDTPTCVQEDWVIHEGLPVFHDGDHVIHT